MIIQLSLAVLMLASFSAKAANDLQEIDTTPKQNYCLKNVESPLLALYKTVNLDKSQLARSVSRTCFAVNQTEGYKPNSIKDHAVNAAMLPIFGLTGIGAGAFSKMQGSDVQKKFMISLEEIRKNPDRMQRIQAVYNLVSEYQGEYDNDHNGLATAKEGKFFLEFTPGNLVDSAKKYGTSGVCRHFASLFYWSLIQVARHPSSKGMALAETDFSPTFKTGWAALGNGTFGGHVWIEVNLPTQTENGLSFYSFTLDTTWYPGRITFLPLRRQGYGDLEERKQTQLDCQMLTRCLGN